MHMVDPDDCKKAIVFDDHRVKDTTLQQMLADSSKNGYMIAYVPVDVPGQEPIAVATPAEVPKESPAIATQLQQLRDANERLIQELLQLQQQYDQLQEAQKQQESEAEEETTDDSQHAILNAYSPRSRKILIEQTRENESLKVKVEEQQRQLEELQRKLQGLEQVQQVQLKDQEQK